MALLVPSPEGALQIEHASCLDCSNFVAFIYNLAFGYYPTSAIGTQACGSTAPGRLLPIPITNLSQLLPGDVVLVTIGKTSSTVPPVRVSHSVLWTNWTVDFTPGASGFLSNPTLIGNLPSSQRRSAVSCMNTQRSRGLPVYVIADSTHAGPGLRPFCGWYMNSYSHARRIIKPDEVKFPLQNNASIAFYDAANTDCMSYWALQAGL
eukprot:gene9974-10128_t